MSGGLRRREVLAALGAAGSPLLLPGCAERTALTGGFAGTHPERGHWLRPGSTPPATTGAPVQRRAQVVIAGAGVAGLAAARALRQRGIEDIAVLELEDTAGGNARAGVLGGMACPLGAHYLPLPSDNASEVQGLLEELGLRKRVAGRWTYDERHLCHSPQERLFFQGAWQPGLLPTEGVDAATRTQYRRFADAVVQARRKATYAIPVSKVPVASTIIALDAITFEAWLDRQGLDDAHLRWYLGYCCRDDYGAGLGEVSAWAGLHYFASRHGFSAGEGPGADDDAAEAVLTWPEGNGWLTRALATPLGDRLHTGRVVTRIAPGKHGVEVDCLGDAGGPPERWQARHCIVALPAFVAARVVQPAPPWLSEAAGALRYAPWLVANLQLRGPLQAAHDGAPPAWDNVVYGSRGLGYVDAGHQRLDPTPGPTVLTWYHAPGIGSRAELLAQPWTHWRDLLARELHAPHPDLLDQAVRLEIARYGHAMAVPVPGARQRSAQSAGLLQSPRLGFAHADWAGYSIFEEAFTLGHRQGSQRF